MARVFVSLGSNINPEDNLQFGLNELRRRFGEVRMSSVYRNKAVGFEGDDFLNLVAEFESDSLPQSIGEQIEDIHALTGRNRKAGKWESRPLDIDLLLYDDLEMDERPVRIPRDDILKYSFVLCPLAELAPGLMHPQTGKTMLEHWQEYDAARHPLLVVDVDI